MNTYLDFISDEDLMRAIQQLYEVYEKTKQEMTETEFYKNKIDPIKLLFDTKFNGRTLEETIELEIIRKKDKTISNAIGTFHEHLLGSIKGYQQYPVGAGYDIRADDHSIYIDVKNKHNTVKGSDLKNLYCELEKYIYISEHEEAQAYLAQIIAKQSINEPWSIPKHGLYNNRIYKISADQLYKKMTGNPEAFKELCEVLPRAIDDFLKKHPLTDARENNIVSQLSKRAKEQNTDMMIELFNKTFDTYLGFPMTDDDNEVTSSCDR